MSSQSIFTADPFSDSKQEIDIRSHVLSESFATDVTSQEKLFQPKCSSIAYMKTEQIPSAAGSLIAASAKYVCYVLKDKLVRVINRSSGQKCLLKHHSERITQIKFSSTDDSVLCTADAGTGAQTHVFIIQLVEAEAEVMSVVLQELTFPVSFIRPTPLLNRAFVFAHDSTVAFYHSRSEDLMPFAAMSTLPHVELPHKQIVDLAISRDGSRICALCRDDTGTSGATLTLHALAVHINPATESCILQTITHLNATPVPSPLFSGPFCALLANDQVLVGATDLASRDERTLRLQAWTTIGPPRCTQSITIKLPATTAPDNSVLCDVDPTGRFLVMADEATPIALIFAVTSEKRQLPLNYLAICSLSLPILSLATLTAKGQEHYSDEEIEHLEVNCYQFQSMPQQLVVQQYFVPTSLCSNQQLPSHETNGHALHNEAADATRPLQSPTNAPVLHAVDDLLMRLRQGSTPPPTTATATLEPSDSPAAATTPSVPSISRDDSRGKTLLQLIGREEKSPSPVSAPAPAPAPIAPAPTSPILASPEDALPKASSTIGPPRVKQSSNTKAKQSVVAQTIVSPAAASRARQSPTADVDSMLREMIKEERSNPATPTPSAEMLGQASAAADASVMHLEVREQTKMLRAQSNALKQLPDSTQKVVKSAVENATKKLVKEFAQTTRTAMIEVNQQDLEPKLEEAIFRAVRETFQRSLIPAIEASVERMFSQIEDSVKVVLEKSQQNDSAKMDALNTQVRELTDLVRRLESAQGARLAAPVEPAIPVLPFTFAELRGWLQKEHRVSDAFEAALESQNPVLLEQLCGIANPRAVIANCSQAILLCIVQQLSLDLPALSHLPSEDAVDRLQLRVNWLKQCTLRLVSNDSTTRQHLSKTLSKVKANVEQAASHLHVTQPHLDQLAMDMMLLAHVVNTLMGSTSR